MYLRRNTLLHRPGVSQPCVGGWHLYPLLAESQHLDTNISLAFPDLAWMGAPGRLKSCAGILVCSPSGVCGAGWGMQGCCGWISPAFVIGAAI